MAVDKKTRCFGNGNTMLERYHDNEWGVPVHDDNMLFELLTLEGAQAGLSWEIILKKRTEYRKAFHDFDPALVANMTDEELDTLVEKGKIVKHKLKIYSARSNAQAFLKIQEEHGSFNKYIWHFTDFITMKGNFSDIEYVPTQTPLSEKISEDLKSRGFKYVGPTIVYSYMQAIGIVNDHVKSCWCYSR